MTFTVLGPPRTKKTSNRVVRAGRRVRVLPSEAYETWEGHALLQLRAQFRRQRMALSGCPLTVAVNVRALIYRDANRGDATGYYQAIGDALERSGVLANDRLIESWDGSRRLIDRANPRVEIELTEMATP